MTEKNGLRVLLVTPSFGRNGGVAAHVANSAIALRDSGSAVTVVAATSDSSTSKDVDQYELANLDSSPHSEEVGRRFSDLLDAERPDVVHFHDLADRNLIFRAQARAPVVASVHGYAGCTPNTYYFSPGKECHRAHGPGCVANMALRGCAHTRDPRGLPSRYRATTRRLAALRQVDRLVVYSEAMASHLRRNDLLRYTLVPLFATTDPDPAPPPRNRQVIFAGRVVGAKGLGVLLDAAAALDCTIAVYGDGWWLPRARTQAERLGIEDRVAFHGWTAEEELIRGYRDSRVAVVPSLWPEPFGLVGIEAMAHGRAVVASDTGGVREWLVHGETGFLVQAGDPGALRSALHRLLEDYDLSVEMGAAGYARGARLFSSVAHVAELDSVYSDARSHWRSVPPQRRDG